MGRSDAPQRNPMPPRRRGRKRRRRLGWLLLLVVLLVIMFLAALVLGRTGDEVPPPSSSSASIPVASVAASSSPAPFVPEAVGNYIESGAPPLFNFQNFIPDDYPLSLSDVGNGQQMDARAAAAFLDMQKAAYADGIALTPLSGYRTTERQSNNYYSSVQQYLSQGYSQEEAERLTRRYYAIPGTSEHEVGLAVDINSIEESFAQTDAFAWLQKNASDYGFILRYRAEWEMITGIAYEPWHYRYVGSNHAKAIEQLNVTLEEYIAMLEGQPFDASQYAQGNTGTSPSSSLSGSSTGPSASSGSASGSSASSAGSGGRA